jgi:hypothetical protein
MAKYRKKPVVVEAEQFVNGETVEGMCANIACPVLPPHVHTLEGTLHVSDGDWIICGVNGEFYPCKPDIFEATYEPVEALSGKQEPCAECRCPEGFPRFTDEGRPLHTGQCALHDGEGGVCGPLDRLGR